MTTKQIRFKFRCSAFGWHYWDVITPHETFEVRHQNTVESCPEIEPHWSGIITEEIRSAWFSHCREKQSEYEAWKLKHADLLLA